MRRDRKAVDRYLDVVFFHSYESAVENSNLLQTQRLSKEMMGFTDGAPTFDDLDIEDRS